MILNISSSIDYDPWEENSPLIQEVGKLKSTNINNHKEVIRLAICLYGMIELSSLRSQLECWNSGMMGAIVIC